MVAGMGSVGHDDRGRPAAASAPRPVNDFTLIYDGFDSTEEGLRETLTSTGNGYYCTRGAAEWEDASAIHYPGTYAHGVYDRETTIMGGHPVLNEDLVNLPNWLVLKLRIGGEEILRLENLDVLSYRHALDVRNALVIRELRFRDRTGRQTRLESRRFVSMNRMHQAALAWDLTAENWSGSVEVVAAVDGRVLNQGVARYRQLEGRHLDPQGPRVSGPDVIALKATTRHSRIEVAVAARARVYRRTHELAVARQTVQTQDYVQQVLEFDVQEGEPVRVEKLAALYTSRDRAIDEPLTNAIKSVARYPAFDEAFAGHARAWEELWEVCDIRLPGDERAQFLLRLHISHVLQVCSRLTAHHDAGVPARGLNGEAYRGHVFWDELYVYPFLNFRLPEITRGLLMYRYRRIGEARAAARDVGCRGAMFPWQSGSDGDEETQRVHLNPLSGRWEPDLSRNQRHVNAAIFYNIWCYYHATHDLEFLRDHGAEMLLEIARFWSSIAHHNPERDRWEIHGIMGPDEFHEKYPDVDEGGLRNNTYTNVMVAWICETAQKVLDLLPASRRGALRAKIGLSDEEMRRWEEMSRRMFVPFHADGVISQFEGYEDLEELDWDAYRERYGDIHRLDRILRAEGDDPNRYKIAKQADAVMLFFLFSDDELGQLFGRLGYEYEPDTARKTIEYYDRRTSHGSTLSFIVHAGVLAAIDPASSWVRFLDALESDVGDVQRGTTREGIHMGVMCGTIDLIQRAYLGVAVRDGVAYFDPRLMDGLDGLSLPMQFRGTPINVTLEGGELTVAALADGFSAPIRVGVGEDVRELGPDGRCVFTVARAVAARGQR
jgi:trehalose/maltose hydrolase-like predicted phosphorylase